MNLCGIDEAGRGSIAGPLSVAGCILKKDIKDLNDSKKLTVKKREYLYEIIKENFPKNIPIAIGLPFGHESDNEAFITGNTYELEVNDSGSRLAPVL